MRKFFISLLLLGCINFSSIQSLEPSSSQIQEAQTTEIVIVSNSSFTLDKERVIKDLLSLQSSLIVPVQNPILENFAKKGFLLIKMTPEYVNSLLNEKNGLIVSAYQKECLVGYVLLTDISEFKELYQDETIGYIETTLNLEKLEKLLSRADVGYIEQIAVNPSFSRSKIGKRLIDECKKIKPLGLVADVFIDPLVNKASLAFFSSQGFEKSGILHQYPRINFPHAHETQVFFWNLSLK
jgi:ribosomal protein S18 acetylase RimI-like enzyme